MSSLDPFHTSIYLPRDQEWIHQVQEPTPAEDPRLYPVHAIETIIRPSRPTTIHQPQIHPQKWWSRCLAQDAPEFGAAIGFIGDFLEESHVVSTHAELLDPTIGRLLALGKALDVENSSTRLVDIAAFASGPIGADLCVGAVTDRFMGINGARGVGVEVPRMHGGSEVVWSGESGIKQVVFAGGARRSKKPNLAVRTTVGTTVLKQTRLQSPLPGRQSRFAARRLVEVSSNGGAAHAHVEFNPWYERQFAIIDESGKWKVWDMEGLQSMDARMQRELALEGYTSGRVSSDGPAPGEGWGRITWGGDLHTLLACDRRRARLFDIRTPQTRFEIPILTELDRILDLQHGPYFETSSYDAFVLTSTALTWVDLRQSGKPLMNIPHYRHPDDLSLTMELLDLSSTIMGAFLYSRFNNLITTHCLTSLEMPTLLGPPKLFQSPILLDVTTPVSFGISIVPCRLVTRSNPNEAAEKYLNDENLKFFTGFGIGKQLDVTQRIYANRDLCGRDPEGFSLVDKIGSQARSAAYIIDEEEDHDEESMELEMRGLNFEGHEGSDTDATYTEFGNPCTGERFTGPQPIRVDFNTFYRYAFTDDTTSLKTASADDPENSIEASVSQLKTLLQKRASKGDLGIISLLNLYQPARLYDRLDELEDRIRDLLADPTLGEYKVKSLILASGNGEFLPTHKDTEDPIDIVGQTPIHISILPLYNTLLETWVTPLPTHTPPKTRLQRERICRSLATEAWLSSIGLHLEPQVPPSPSPPPQTPLPSSPPPETDPALTLPEPLHRIRTYANVSTRITLPTDLQGVLDKWEIGEDPWEYEYNPDENGVRKSKKRRSQHHRRKARGEGAGVRAGRGEVESWQKGIEGMPPAIMLSSQVPGGSQGGGGGQRVGGSQGMGPPAAQRSSQGEVVMSQVERGKHGGRVGARKKRKTGF